MNKKRIIYLIAVFFTVIAFVLIWLFISFQNKQSNQALVKQELSNNQKRPTARDAGSWDEPFLKEIKTEFVEKDELKKMGLADNPLYDLQVLERDVSGTVTAYKKIYKEDDIIRYLYDSNLAITPTSNIATSTATGTPAR